MHWDVEDSAPTNQRPYEQVLLHRLLSSSLFFTSLIGPRQTLHLLPVFGGNARTEREERSSSVKFLLFGSYFILYYFILFYSSFEIVADEVIAARPPQLCRNVVPFVFLRHAIQNSKHCRSQLTPYQCGRASLLISQSGGTPASLTAAISAAATESQSQQDYFS